MVKRIESVGLEEFTATVKTAQKEEQTFDGEQREQYHITMDAHDIEVKGPTGVLHEWIPLSAKSTEEQIPQGSVVDRYLQQIEICISEAKNAETVSDAFKLMVGKKFKFKRLKLGRDFDGHKAREYIAPVALVE